MNQNSKSQAGHSNNTLVSRRFFRVLKIRLLGRYGLLKSVHRKIFINMLYERIKMFRCVNEQINPQEFNDTMNKAQLNFLNQLQNDNY